MLSAVLARTSEETLDEIRRSVAYFRRYEAITKSVDFSSGVLMDMLSLIVKSPINDIFGYVIEDDCFNLNRMRLTTFISNFVCYRIITLGWLYVNGNF
jgi:hypothetical protein